ncbi:MAG: sulfate reduction electron transfer complex DsrMKJOP subunit DsrM [Deltaproteobacteria bacterium]|nr:sulfate reduction electron transfer complex DsrMKJOP subunit DsrM [Deltaproteobacteria bacterium]
MNAILSLIVSSVAVFGLVAIAFVGVWGAHLEWLFGVIIPYLAVITFFVGIVYRVVQWAKCPVPFRIPSTCGQQKTLAWLPRTYVDKLDNPSTTAGAVCRMILEVLCFRSLFRNTRLEFGSGQEIKYKSAKWLWVAAMAFHYTFLVVILRHLRFFTEPMPFFVPYIEKVDGFFQIFVPTLYQSGFLLGAALTFLLLRRLIDPKLRYISLPADYFPLFLILGLVTTGILMRYVLKADVVSIKELTMGLVSFRPVVPEGISVLFYIHVFLVSVLFAYFPFSKLTTYQAYEDEFREKMIDAGLPVEKGVAEAE